MMAQPAAKDIDGPQDTTSTLKLLLARLCADTSVLHAEKRDAAEGRACLLQTLLYEIDETILPRQLSLYFGQNLVAELTISHRRLLSLELVNSPDRADPPSRVDQTPAAQTYVRRLLTLETLYKSTGFQIKRRACETIIETESCSAPQLIEILEAQQHDSRMQSFLALIRPHATAWVLLGEESSTSSGPDGLVQRLSDLGAADKTANQTRGQALRMPDTAPRCMMLSMSSETQVLVARDQAETLLVALPTQHLTATSQTWHRVFAPQHPPKSPSAH